MFYFKKSILFIAILGMASLSQSCKKTPTACFTASSTSVSVGDNVTFTNCSENAKSYSWDFGDGVTSTDENPTHSYSNAGTYTVTMDCYNMDMGSNMNMSSSDMAEKTESITVN